MSTPTYLAIDLETTGLDPHTCAILEVAAFVLDENFVELDRYVSAIECDDEALDRADHVVLRMHRDTGLIERLSMGLGWRVGRGAQAKNSIKQVERCLTAMCLAFPKRPTLVGQSVHFDRSFLREHMPNVERGLDHRHVDARTVMQLAPELPWPEPKVKHVAEDDLDATVDALRMARGLLDTLAAAQPRIEALLDIERERDEVREILGTPAGCSLTQWATDVSKDANEWRSLARNREMDL